MTRPEFDPKNPSLSPATMELLLRLDGLTARLEQAVMTLEEAVGACQVPDEEDE